MRVVSLRRLVSGLVIASLSFFLLGSLGVPSVLAAPSGQIQVEADNVLQLGDSQQVVVTFQNTAGADITDVASTIQYIALAAADLNPSRTIVALDASWEIYVSETAPTPRATGSTTATLDSSAIYSPYSTTETVYLYTWALGAPSGALSQYTSSSEQFTSDLKILRPGEVIKLAITAECQGVVGDSRLWFFFRATEYEPSQVLVSNLGDINPKWNLYYSKRPGPDQTKYWWPLHNSYDPYDSDIGTGHNFDQLSWVRGETAHAFAKSNKLVHQKPVENPAQPCINITKDGPVQAVVDETITYEFTVTNCGNVALTNVTVTDDVLGTIPSPPSPSTLAVGESVTFTVQHTVTGTDPDPLENTATASGWHDDQEVTEEASHSVDITEAANACINITKDGPAEVLIGETITYEFTVTNCGNVALTDVTVDDTLLGDSIWSASTLSVGESVTFTRPYTVAATDPNPLVNTATASGWYGDQEETSQASDSVIIDPPFSFHICGIKFLDADGDGEYDVEVEPGIDEVTVTLLGPDKETPAEIYYAGKFIYPPPEANPLETGENELRGSYCFNLENVIPGTYTFYVREELPSGTIATTPTLIGPITLVASDTGPRESLNNHFGNVKPAPFTPAVGGAVHPVNKSVLLAPWLALAIVLMAGTIVVWKKRRMAQH